MKLPFGVQKIILVLGVLVLAQFACSLSAPASTSVPALIASSVPQATQPLLAATAAHGTPEEAKAMLQKAIEHYNSVGRTLALADFNHRVAPFFDRDLYVACIDSTLHQSANGGFPNLVGSAIEPISRAAWDAASFHTVSSINYQWLNPETSLTEPKTFYYEKVGSDVCGVGAYHP
jgi:cytochrome c